MNNYRGQELVADCHDLEQLCDRLNSIHERCREQGIKIEDVIDITFYLYSYFIDFISPLNDSDELLWNDSLRLHQPQHIVDLIADSLSLCHIKILIVVLEEFN